MSSNYRNKFHHASCVLVVLPGFMVKKWFRRKFRYTSRHGYGVSSSELALYIYHSFNFCHYSDAASGWEGWALAHLDLEFSYPITTRGADYARHITASPPGFKNPAASLHYTDQIIIECVHPL